VATTQPLSPVLSTAVTTPVKPIRQSKVDSFQQGHELMEDILLGALLLVVLAALTLVFWRASHEIRGLANIVSVPAQRGDADP
jgi:hypothetical protein